MTGRGYTLLKDHEGLRLKPYYDTAVPPRLTIGWGRNLDDRGISYEEATMLLDNDIANAQADLAQRFPWFKDLDPVRSDVMVMLAFNLGISGLCGFKRMIAAIERQDWEHAAWELSNSQWKLQVGKERHDCLTHALEKAEWV